MVPYPTDAEPNPGPSTPNEAPPAPAPAPPKSTPNPPFVVFVVVVVVVTLVVPKPADPSTPTPPAPNCKVPKSTVPPTGGRTLVPKSIVVVEIPCPIPTPSIGAKLVVPKSIASLTVVVESEPAWATPGPCLTVTLRIDCLTTSGLTLTVSCLVSLTTDSLTISLWTCPLISCVASVSFL